MRPEADMFFETEVSEGRSQKGYKRGDGGGGDGEGGVVEGHCLFGDDDGLGGVGWFDGERFVG